MGKPRSFLAKGKIRMPWAVLLDSVRVIPYRDSRCYPLDALKSLKQSEKMQCEKITKQLGLPLYIHQMLFDDSDVQQVREYILGGE